MNKIKATVTLRRLREHHACSEGYNTLVASLPEGYGDDTPISLLGCLKSNPVEDVYWALRAVQQDILHLLPLVAADCAESVLRVYESNYPGDLRPRRAIEAARTGVNAADAADAAYDAADAADAAYAAYAAHVAILHKYFEE